MRLNHVRLSQAAFKEYTDAYGPDEEISTAVDAMIEMIRIRDSQARSLQYRVKEKIKNDIKIERMTELLKDVYTLLCHRRYKSKEVINMRNRVKSLLYRNK